MWRVTRFRMGTSLSIFKFADMGQNPKEDARAENLHQDGRRNVALALSYERVDAPRIQP